MMRTPPSVGRTPAVDHHPFRDIAWNTTTQGTAMSDQGTPVHVLLTMKVNDPAMLGRYFEAATPLMMGAGIQLLSAGTDTVTVSEGSWDHNRVVLMSAPSRQAWDRFYDSEEYRSVRHLREESTDSMLAVLDGISFEL